MQELTLTQSKTQSNPLRCLLATVVALGTVAFPAAVYSAEEAIKEPKAYRLMRKAVEARATWDEAFPGFTADIAVNYAGKRTQGNVRVSPQGEIKRQDVADPDTEAWTWARGWLASIVSHRLGSGGSMQARYGGIRLAKDAGQHHPLGFKLVLDDSLNSAFRVEGQVIRQVNRDIPSENGLQRVRINVLDTETTSEGGVLPRHFVIHYLDPKGQLMEVENVSTQFTTVDGYPLPVWRRVITVANDGHMTTGTFRLSEHRLLNESEE